jgi:hypothetical protein
VNGGDLNAYNQGAMFGSGVGVVAGLATSKKVDVVQIPQGGVYILSLQAPIALMAAQPVAQFR